MWLAGVALAAEVTLWHPSRGAECDAIERLAATWNAAHPDLTLLPIFVPYGEMVNKVEAAVPHGNGPDLFIFANERVAD